MRIRLIISIILILMTLITVIIQLLGIPYILNISSNHDLEFTYEYKWDLIGTGGWFDGYSESFYATGYYYIDFNGDMGNVTGEVSWSWSENYYGTSQSSIDHYDFSYSLINGSYIWGTDQDEIDTTGKNVWFHIPQGFSAQNIGILDANYIITGSETFWAGHLMPFLGIKLYSSGTFQRDDVYGKFDVDYRSTYYFTPDGYLLGELWEETDEGYDKDTGLWSEFTLNSYLCVISSSYIRPFDFVMYFLTYWSWLCIIGVVLFVVYETYRGVYKKCKWRPQYISTTRDKQGSNDIIIERNLPKDAELSISSSYAEVIPSYLINANLQNKLIISAQSNDKVMGIGIIDQKKNIGTFFGFFIEGMIKYSKVKYAFCESNIFTKFKIIEKYDIFQINQLQNQDFNFDATVIKPATDIYLNSIMKLIASEDYGKKGIKRAKWVMEAAKNDIIVIATVNKNENWIKDILYDVNSRQYPKPEECFNEILLGVGFATPGDTTGWLYGLYVHPAFRNFGIGYNLVLARLSMLQGIGCKNAITEIAEWNSPAKSIYKHLNTKNIGKIILFGKKMPKVKVRRY